MTYQINRGPFIVNKLTSSVSITNYNFLTINLTDHRTSAGQITGKPNLTGLAFSDMTTETGGGHSAIGMHRPSVSSGEYGADQSRFWRGRGSAGSLGVSLLSAETAVIQYRAGYDANDTIVNDSYTVVL